MAMSLFVLDWMACFVCLGAAYGGLRFLVDLCGLTRRVSVFRCSPHRGGSAESPASNHENTPINQEFPASNRENTPINQVFRRSGAPAPASGAITGGKIRRIAAVKIVELLDACEFTDGKHAGKTFLAAHTEDPGYDKWIMDRPSVTKKEVYRLYMAYAILQRLL